MKINFASDNYAGIHPDILRAINEANHGHVPAYGGDQYTADALQLFQDVFDKKTNVFFVFNGTGANVTALSALMRSYEAIICAEKAHIQMDECGAPEKFTGSKLLLIPTNTGKVTVEAIKLYLQRVGDQHHVQPRVISLSQSTEYGTVYQLDEIAEITEFAHAHQLYVHMDGARISNAAVSLGCTFREMTKDVGVDILSFGGTKNGMMLGEAVVIFNPDIAEHFAFIRKQSMQLASKMRFIAAQFSALLKNNLWKDNAQHANAMAQRLSIALNEISEIKMTNTVQANAIFAIFPEHIIPVLQEKYYFYVWDEQVNEVRLMTSFDTSPAEVDQFVRDIKQALSQ